MPPKTKGDKVQVAGWVPKKIADELKQLGEAQGGRSTSSLVSQAVFQLLKANQAGTGS